jgi:hypothetical protein
MDFMNVMWIPAYASIIGTIKYTASICEDARKSSFWIGICGICSCFPHIETQNRGKYKTAKTFIKCISENREASHE